MDITPIITVKSKLFFLTATITVIIDASTVDISIENLLFEINSDDTTRAVKIEMGIYFKNSAVLSFILILESNITGSVLGSIVTIQPPIIMYQIYIFISLLHLL